MWPCNDIVMDDLLQQESGGLRPSELILRRGRFCEDKRETAMAYWKAMYNGVQATVPDGRGPVSDILTPSLKKLL